MTASDGTDRTVEIETWCARLPADQATALRDRIAEVDAALAR